MIEKMRRKYRGFINKRIKPCKECGNKGYMEGHGKGYVCACLHCTNGGKVMHTRFGALMDWNQKNLGH